MRRRQHALKRRCAKFEVAVVALDPETLTERQREVAKLRSSGLSLAAIGARLGISGERVRQIEARLKTRSTIRTVFDLEAASPNNDFIRPLPGAGKSRRRTR